MKKYSNIEIGIVTVLVIFSLVGFCFAAEKATKAECVTKCKEAVEMINKIGLEATLEKISNPEGPFKWKDTYVFCMESETGKILAHPIPKFIGFSMKTWRNADGEQPFVKLLEEAEKNGEGWISYMYPKPGTEKASLKTTYFIKVPGQKAILCAGVYE